MGDASNYDGSDDCLDGPHSCTGEVFPRPALSGSGEHYTRCDGHWEAYYERTAPRMAEIRSRYPNTAPDDFDPMTAGERWSDQDPWP
ncbi:hypothetical protein [Mycobacterium avium]|uniref:Uncharacterized protein n=1 Tax=Mycobacterium avium subsp. hominissuis TaxID=439334 RepID=A0AAI8SSS3_MYCAV|nr:hypothetical protein [Mycobacterium avium]PBA08513.1 hypothetical protein CKJ70_26055 [Mycobacterium avium]BBN50779.1 hypothetical protein JPH1_52540 [Mycobacterium avium subsp. hominissuis]